MADGNSPARPEGLVAGSGRAGERKDLGSSLDPDMASDNLRRVAERVTTVKMVWRMQLTDDEVAAMATTVAALRRLIDRINASRPRNVLGSLVMKTPEEKIARTTPARMLRAHLYGIVIGNALGAITWVLIKKHVEPLLDPAGSLQDTLGKLVKNLPTPGPDADDAPPRPSRTGQGIPHSSDI